MAHCVTRAGMTIAHILCIIGLHRPTLARGNVPFVSGSVTGLTGQPHYMLRTNCQRCGKRIEVTGPALYARWRKATDRPD